MRFLFPNPKLIERVLINIAHDDVPAHTLGLSGCQMLSAFESVRGSGCSMPERFAGAAKDLAHRLNGGPYQLCSDLLTVSLASKNGSKAEKIVAGPIEKRTVDTTYMHPLVSVILSCDGRSEIPTESSVIQRHLLDHMPSEEQALSTLMAVHAAAGPAGAMKQGSRAALRMTTYTVAEVLQVRNPKLPVMASLSEIDAIYPKFQVAPTPCP